MAWYHEIVSSLGALFGSRRQESEMAEEIGYHIEMETRRLVEAGMDENEAHRRAVRDFGGVERHKDDVRDERGLSWLRDGWSDVRFAARSLRRRPGFTAVATITLALGIGATTTLFGVVKQVLLTPLPYGHPEGLVMVWSAWKGFDQTWLSYDEWEGWRARVHAFEDIGLFAEGSANFDGDTPERVRTAQVQANIFPILGVQPLLGRNFTAEEDRPGGPSVVILGYGLWQRRFGGDPSVIGRQVGISGQPTTVVGVMPADFRLPLDFGAGGRTDAWFPLATDAAQNGALPGPEFPKGGANNGYDGVARLRPGATAATANAQLRSLVAELEQWGYMSDVGFHAYAVPIEEQITGRVRPVLLVVFGAVGFVMLIACANVAGLLLARGRARIRELSVRAAIGAARRRIVRQLVTESAMIAAAGACIGILLARWLSAALAPALGDAVEDARWLSGLDMRVVVFAAGIAAACALMFGVVPAFRATDVDVSAALQDTSRGAVSQRRRLSGALVVAQIAMSLLLVAGAGLLVRSLRNLEVADLGFNPSQLLLFRIDPTVSGYEGRRAIDLYGRILDRARATPGVVAASLSSHRLISNSSAIAVTRRTDEHAPAPGSPDARAFDRAHFSWNMTVDERFFDTLGIRMLRGRAFEPADETGAPVVVVNQALARQLFQSEDVVGRELVFGSSKREHPTPLHIVGVVADARYTAMRAPKPPTFYMYYRQQPEMKNAPTFEIRTAGPPSAIAAPMREILHEIDPNLPMFAVTSQSDQIASSLKRERLFARLATLLGCAAVMLSAIGLYGLLAYGVARRTREIGLRIALGAARRTVIWMVFGESIRLVALGVIIGIPAALAGTKILQSLLFGLDARDPITLALACAVMTALALLASYLPARRAARVDPMVALRAE
jgi:predicted permease